MSLNNYILFDFTVYYKSIYCLCYFRNLNKLNLILMERFEIDRSIYNKKILQKSIKEFEKYYWKKIKYDVYDSMFILKCEEDDFIDIVDNYIYLYNEAN